MKAFNSSYLLFLKIFNISDVVISIFKLVFFLIGKGGNTLGILLQYFCPTYLLGIAFLNVGNNPIFCKFGK